MMVLSRTTEDPSVVAIKRPLNLMSRVRRGFRQYQIAQDFAHHEGTRPSGYDLFTDDRSEFGSALVSQIPPCDVINLHWVPGFLDYEMFFRNVPIKTPVVWTLHDMNPFTGGCHYDLGCERYVDHCKRCPQLGSTTENDLSFKIWERKRGVFSRISRSRLHIVTPSKWLAKEVKRSPILGEFPVSVIPYGLNLDDFVPKDRFAIRDLLGIPQDAMVVLFVAERPDNRRKGFSLLIDALNRAADAVPSLFLLSLGDGRPQAKVKIPWMH